MTTTPTPGPETVELVREYAKVCRGEHPQWEGDRVLNAFAFAVRVGREYPGDVSVYLQSLLASERELSILSGLPPSSLHRLAADLRSGRRAAGVTP